MNSPNPPLLRTAAFWWWLVLAMALVLRLAWLGMKPPHFDEGVNGWFIDQMAQTGFYRYDPGNYHGPFHFYVLYFAQTLFGRDVVALRVPIVLVNIASLWMVWLFARFVGTRVALLACAAFAVSTGMIFYSRYAIHEAWQVLGILMALWGLFEAWKNGTRSGLYTLVAGVTLMILTKETYVIHGVALLLAWPTLLLLERWSPSSPPEAMEPATPQWDRRALLTSLAVAGLVLLFFYSGGLMDFSALPGMVTTFGKWFSTGVSDPGHVKPWYYWLQLLFRHEWPALLGLLFAARALFPGMNRYSRFIAIYGCGVLVGYTLVPYKTPWCVISLIWPFFFLFGEAVRELTLREFKPVAATVALLLLGGSLAGAVRLNFVYPAVPEEEIFFHPKAEELLIRSRLISKEARYIYVQTLNDWDELFDPLTRLTQQNPIAFQTSGHVILSSYHPLPWALGNFTSIGYYDDGRKLPTKMDAGFLVVEEDRVDEVEAALKERYFVSPFQLRDGMSGGQLYLNHRLFEAFFPGRQPEFDPS